MRRIQQSQAMIRGPASARRTLVQRRDPPPWFACLVCGARRPYGLDDGRWRCRVRTCGYTFGVRTGTWAGLSRVPDVTWLWLVKLFELELTASQAAVQTGVSYPTAHKAFTLLRRAVLATAEPELFRQ